MRKNELPKFYNVNPETALEALSDVYEKASELKDEARAVVKHHLDEVQNFTEEQRAFFDIGAAFGQFAISKEIIISIDATAAADKLKPEDIIDK